MAVSDSRFNGCYWPIAASREGLKPANSGHSQLMNYAQAGIDSVARVPP